MQRIIGTLGKTSAIALALALAGCGGGGGGGADAPAAGAPVGGTPVAERIVQGTAAKGLIKGAKVSLYAIDAQGVRAATALATATTGADGTYKLQVAATVLNFVIEVSAAPGATMADEATGADIPVPENMKLRSVVTLASAATGTYEGTVSPLTEMVAQTAQTADGKLPQQAVAQAKASVRTLFGFDPETVKPVNSNSAAAANASEDEKNQSLALAAMSKMASSPTAACAQTTVSERVACVVSGVAGALTIVNGQAKAEPARLTQLREAMQTVALDKTINRTGKNTVVGIPGLTPTGVLPAVSALPPLEATKALFGSLRTNLRALEDGAAFQETVDGIRADLDGSVAPLANRVGYFTSFTLNALVQLDRYRSGASTTESFQVWNYNLYDAQGFAELPYMYRGEGDGTCTIVKSPLAMTCNTVQVGYLPRESSYDRTTQTIVHIARTLRIEPKAGTPGVFTYTTSFAKQAVKSDFYGNQFSLPPAQPLGGTFSGDLGFAHDAGVITKLTVNGRLPGQATEEGTVIGDYEDWSLSAERTQDENGIALYRFGGVVNAIDGGKVSGQVEIDSASFLRMAAGSNNKVLVNPANELQVTLRGWLGRTSTEGTVRIWDHKQDKSKTAHMPTRLSFDGSLKHADATVFSGRVAIARNGYENFDATADESETNFVADSIQVAGTLSVPKRPALSLSIGATRVGLDAADISAQYSDGSSIINASMTATAGERHPLVTVASVDGVAFSFSDTSAPVKVRKDGAVTAELNLSSGIITYSDGGTESLK